MAQSWVWLVRSPFCWLHLNFGWLNSRFWWLDFQLWLVKSPTSVKSSRLLQLSPETHRNAGRTEAISQAENGRKDSFGMPAGIVRSDLSARLGSSRRAGPWNRSPVSLGEAVVNHHFLGLRHGETSQRLTHEQIWIQASKGVLSAAFGYILVRWSNKMLLLCLKGNSNGRKWDKKKW